MKKGSVVTERGQITIPKGVRDRFGLRPGMRVRFVPSRHGVLLQKQAAGSDPFRKVFGIVQDREPTDAYIKRLRGPAK